MSNFTNLLNGTNSSETLHANITNCSTEEVSEANVSGEILLMMLLLSLSLGGGHYLKKHKFRFINEPLLATLIGLIAGGIMTLIQNEKYINNITTAYVKFFLIILLPPIIFESAYNMRRKEFFKNVGSISIFAFLGTIISILFIGLSIWVITSTGLFNQVFTLKESLSYGSLISATDPVSIISAFKDYSTDPNFFQLIYGESILNDAVSIVFYDTCVNFSQSETVVMSILKGVLSFLMNIIGSTLLGFAIGFLTAVFLKMISGRVKNIEKIEIGLMVILPQVSYLTAQMLSLSGIVSLLFNGIAHASYTKPNLTDWSKITVKTSYEGVSNIFETLIFIFLGIGFFSFKHPYGEISPFFVVILLIVILFGRMLNIFICAKFANFSRSDNLIDKKKGFFLWFAGVRGAMAFALAIKSKIDFPKVGPMFLVLTLIVISFTLLYSTFFLDLVIRKCDIVNICEADNFEESNYNKNSFEKIKSYIEEFNFKYLVPFVTRDNRDGLDKSNLNEPPSSNSPNDNKLEIKNRSVNLNKDPPSKTYFEKRPSEDTTLDKKNFQIKNIHLFE